MDITVIRDRFAQMGIRLLPSAGRVERFAAKELAWYLYKISKSGIVIMESFTASENEIFLTASGDAQEDSFSIKAAGNRIELVGSNARSVLFAVYEFLERLGCSFAHPFQEYIPEKATIEVEEFSYQWKADIPERGIFQAFFLKRKAYNFDGFVPERRLPQIAYAAKNKFNTYTFSCDYNRLDLWDKFKYQIMEELLDRGLKIAFVSATLDYFCPDSEEMDFGDMGDFSYVTKRPQWYHNNILRIELPEVQKFVAERYCSYILSHKEFSSVTFAPRNEIVSKVSLPEGKLLMDLWMEFFNAIARILAQKAPGRTLDVMLEDALLELGKSTVEAEKNIHFIFRSDEKINMHYSFLAPENKELKEAFELLLKKGCRVSFIHGSGETPELSPYWKHAEEFYSFLKEKKVFSIKEFAGHTYNSCGLNFRRCMDYYCCGKFASNEGKSAEEALKQWTKGYFGESGKYITRFYLEMEAEHRKKACEKPLHSKEKWLTLDSFRQVQKNLAAAKEALSNEDKVLKTEEKIDSLEVFAAKSVTYDTVPGFEKEDEFMR